jgi:hypothetical protein
MICWGKLQIYFRTDHLPFKYYIFRFKNFTPINYRLCWVFCKPFFVQRRKAQVAELKRLLLRKATPKNNYLEIQKLCFFQQLLKKLNRTTVIFLKNRSHSYPPELA